MNPDMVIIKLGTNDTKYNLNWKDHKQEFSGDYKDMIKSFRELDSNPEIWICLIVPAYKDIWDISDSTVINGANPEILQVALDEGVGFIDLYTAMSNKKLMFWDEWYSPKRRRRCRYGENHS